MRLMILTVLTATLAVVTFPVGAAEKCTLGLCKGDRVVIYDSSHRRTGTIEHRGRFDVHHVIVGDPRAVTTGIVKVVLIHPEARVHESAVLLAPCNVLIALLPGPFHDVPVLMRLRRHPRLDGMMRGVDIILQRHVF